MSVEQKIRKHQAFWNREEVESPVVGVFLGSWTFFKDNRGGDNIWQLDTITPDDLYPERFIEDYEKLFEAEEEIGDDLIRAAQPFPSIPWVEAIVGCPVKCSKPNVWAEPMAESVTELSEIRFDPDNPWVCKYVEFFDTFGKHFKNRHPVSASILRGPSDILSAMIGDQFAVLAYMDYPEQTQNVLKQITALFCEFIKYQWQYTVKFHNGYTMPQNEIWVPGTPLRMQEDASALVSPDIYERYLLPGDVQIASLTQYSMLHLHTTSLFLLDYFLGNKNIATIQVSKDDGYENFDELIPYLKKIQSAGKRLILRGIFTVEELELLRSAITPVGLCVHTVVKTKEQGVEHLEILRKLWR